MVSALHSCRLSGFACKPSRRVVEAGATRLASSGCIHAPGLTCTGSRSQHPSILITALSKLAPVAAPALHEDGRFGWCVVRRCAWRRDVPFQRSEVGALQLCGRSSLQGGSLVPHRHLQAPNLHVSPAPPSCAPFTALGTPQPLSAATVTCMHGDESTFITGGDDGSMQVPCPGCSIGTGTRPSAPLLTHRRRDSPSAPLLTHRRRPDRLGSRILL